MASGNIEPKQPENWELFLGSPAAEDIQDRIGEAAISELLPPTEEEVEAVAEAVAAPVSLMSRIGQIVTRAIDEAPMRAANGPHYL